MSEERPSSTGTISTATSHRAKIVHARQAVGLYRMLRITTAPATSQLAQVSRAGGFTTASTPFPSQCHGPPSTPGMNVSRISVLATFNTPLKVPGLLGPRVLWPSSDTYATKYPMVGTVYSSQTRQWSRSAVSAPAAQRPLVKNADVSRKSRTGVPTPLIIDAIAASSQNAAATACRNRPVLR